jgi:hypothetical protein
MLREYSQLYNEACAILERIHATFRDVEIDEEKHAPQVFALQALAMSRDQCQAIALLLDADLFGESVSVFRSLFELHFDLLWIQSANDPVERLERAHRLEADPYAKMATEARHLERDATSATPQTTVDKSKQWNQLLDRTIRDRPHLAFTGADGKSRFKTAPPLTERMGLLRTQYYHVYRFACLFSHPSPVLRQLHLQLVGKETSVNEIIEDPP